MLYCISYYHEELTILPGLKIICFDTQMRCIIEQSISGLLNVVKHIYSHMYICTSDMYANMLWSDITVTFKV